MTMRWKDILLTLLAALLFLWFPAPVAVAQDVRERTFQTVWFCYDKKVTAGLVQLPLPVFLRMIRRHAALAECPVALHKPFTARLASPDPVMTVVDPDDGKKVVILKVIVMPNDVAIEGYIGRDADEFSQGI